MKKSIYHESDSPSEDQDLEIRMFKEEKPREAKYPNDDHSRFAGEDYKETSYFELGTEDPVLQEPAVPYNFTIDKQHVGKGPKGYKKDDYAIYEEICENLTRDSYIDASSINVNVEKAVLYLTGEVESEEMRDRVMGLAQEIHGVSHILNEIVLTESNSGPEAVTQKDLGVGENYRIH